jgi:hypothetical protein
MRPEGETKKGPTAFWGRQAPHYAPFLRRPRRSGSADYNKEPLSVSSRRAAVFVDAKSERMTMPTAITNVARLSDEAKSGQIYGVIQLYKLLGDKPALKCVRRPGCRL